jgi:exodeoxyribonuclease V alpha subunit
VGRLERVTYRNPENGFVVARVKARGWPDLVTVVGPLGDPLPGEVLKMQGRWGAHPKFGEQFEVVRYETALPATAAGIEKYLGSGLVKGIGPGLAARIVRVFGAATLEIVDKDPKRLAEVEGIGTLRADRIRVAWGEQREIRNVMLFLQSHGVGPAYAIRIWKRYGTSAVKLLQENPYRLATDVWGIGFLTADRIAGNLGFPPDAPQRAEAGLLYALNRMSDEGHLCAPLSELVRRSAELLEIDGGVMEGAVARVEEAGYLVVDREAREGNPLEPPVYLKTLYLAERGVAGRLAGLLRSPCPLRPVETAKAVPWAEKRLGIELAEGQREALIRAVGEKVLVLTGGPGTGKTTLIRSLLEILSHRTDRIALAAPTGRAAKRMAEATGREAKTIHRLLEWSSQEGDFQRNEENPLECDLLVLDETSMLDIPLANRLLAAVPPGAKLILVGDGDQLPSVGPGSFLADLVASGVVPVARLSEIFRQARSSRIVVSAHRIRDGLAPERVSREERDTSDFHFIPVAEPERIAATLVSLVKEHIPRRFGLDPMEEIQVLTPMKRGLLGAASLNAILQEALNPGETLIRRGSRAFRGGDRVMQIRNDYDRDVYNGDIGRVLGLDGETGELEVRFDDRVVRYAESDLDELIQAYAVTIHKSQGSEYPAVVMPLHTQHYMMLQRNLLYTGVTRGRKLVCIVGSPKALNIAVRNDKTLHRYGRLAERLRTALDAGSPSAGPTAAGAAAPGGDKPGEDASETAERPRRRKRRSVTKPEGGEGS